MALEEHKKKMKEKAEQENSNIWQHPYVDVFKHFKVQPGMDWKSNKKQGDVNEYFVSIAAATLASYFYFIHIGKGNRTTSDQHRGHDLRKQFRAGAEYDGTIEVPGAHRKIHLLPSEVSEAWTSLQLPHRFWHGRAVARRETVRLKLVQKFQFRWVSAPANSQEESQAAPFSSSSLHLSR